MSRLQTQPAIIIMAPFSYNSFLYHGMHSMKKIMMRLIRVEKQVMLHSGLAFSSQNHYLCHELCYANRQRHHIKCFLIFLCLIESYNNIQENHHCWEKWYFFPYMLPWHQLMDYDDPLLLQQGRWERLFLLLAIMLEQVEMNVYIWILGYLELK